MAPSDYKEMYENAKRDLKSAKIERNLALSKAEKAEARISYLLQAAAALAQLCGESFSDQDEFGLTDAIRLAVKTGSGAAFTAVEVRTKLGQLGYDVSADNILPSIHTILKRLVLKGELDDSTLKDGGKAAYRWIEERLRKVELPRLVPPDLDSDPRSLTPPPVHGLPRPPSDTPTKILTGDGRLHDLKK